MASSIGGERREYDLAKRTALFAEQAIRFTRDLKSDRVTKSLMFQCVSSSSSIGANYSEAIEAGLCKEFRYRISICRREDARNAILGENARSRCLGVDRSRTRALERSSRANTCLRRRLSQ